ncbi:MAG: DUF3334 domain-containing protein [Thermodesulfatator sp.]|nr:MAG: DUF3334 domain-containing protein [Thermodesulfatator sp.]
MAKEKIKTVDMVARVFGEAVKEVIEASTGSNISYAPTIQDVPSISLKPDLGCFVQFTGDYSGLFIMNLSGQAALELYRQAMTFMGLPPEELADSYSSDDVVSSVGELINQVIGKARQKIEQQYGLSARNNQPKAITISSAITLSVATMLDRPVCRRLSFRTEGNNPFYVEMNLEQTEFIPIQEVAQESQADIQETVDEALENGNMPGSARDRADDNIDIDALMAEFS